MLPHLPQKFRWFVRVAVNTRVAYYMCFCTYYFVHMCSDNPPRPHRVEPTNVPKIQSSTMAILVDPWIYMHYLTYPSIVFIPTRKIPTITA